MSRSLLGEAEIKVLAELDSFLGVSSTSQRNSVFKRLVLLDQVHPNNFPLLRPNDLGL